MKRREFLRTTAIAGASIVLHENEIWSQQPARSTVILRGATIYDGTGARPITADVAIEGDRIVGLGRRLNVASARIIDLRGLALAPGFIDIHSHTERVLLTNPRAEAKVRQGVTTETAGADGGSLADLPGFMAQLEAAPAAVNWASMVGAGSIRQRVVGNDDRPPTADELQRMVGEVRAALQAGAVGLSSGLEYTPGGFAQIDELIALAAPLKGTGLPYATHMRNEDDELLASIEEAIGVARRAGVPLQISHLKVQGGRNWWKTDTVIALIEQAAKNGTDVRFDRYPYIAYQTGLANMFPLWSRDGGSEEFLKRLADPTLAARIEAYVRDKVDELGSWDAIMVTSTGDAASFARGQRLGTLAQARAVEPYALLLEITRLDQNRSGMVGFGMSEATTEPILAHPLCMISSDAGARANTEGSTHPRAYGTFPRVLGHYVRERKLMPLETAIHKMTQMPAQRVKLEGRGIIQTGAFADLVAFDPVRVRDTATFDQPHQYPEGIPHVWVNGIQVVRDGVHTDARPGRVLRSTLHH
jgi:N-acyl-D-amino-acid deacylase